MLVLAAVCRPVAASTGPNVVKVVSQGQNYALMLNGKPFYIQGAGAGEAFGGNGENYLKMAKEMGANAVRTWGIEQGDQKYLDEAAAQGLYVAAGIWLDYPNSTEGISYVNGQDTMKKKEKEVLDYVERYKGHPAVLLWVIGNEVIAFTQSEEEKIAFARFLDQLVRKVHTADPDHPVAYASSGKTDLPYLKRYVPSLDIIGINDYSDVQFMENAWLNLGFDAPYLLTEYGASGSWELPKDANGRRIEQSDYAKAAQYRNYWKRVREKKGNNVGGFVFHLGNTTQESLTFYNINEHGDRREAYRMIQSLYTGQAIANHAPRIQKFKGVLPALARGASFEVEIDAKDAEGDPLEYDYKASTAVEGVFAYHVNEEVPIQVRKNGNHATLTAPDKGGIYRFYGFVRDDHGNVSSVSATARVS